MIGSPHLLQKDPGLQKSRVWSRGCGLHSGLHAAKSSFGSALGGKLDSVVSLDTRASCVKSENCMRAGVPREMEGENKIVGCVSRHS